MEWRSAQAEDSAENGTIAAFSLTQRDHPAHSRRLALAPFSLGQLVIYSEKQSKELLIDANGTPMILRLKHRIQFAVQASGPDHISARRRSFGYPVHDS